MDLNSDLAESFGRWELTDDAALLRIVTSANVACGYHAGDATVIRRACEQAAERGVSVGAQVSYRDLAGFGRRFIDVPPAELTDDVIYQIGALAAELLTEIVTADDVLGLAWARSVNAMAEAVRALPPCPLVQLCGVHAGVDMRDRTVETVDTAGV